MREFIRINQPQIGKEEIDAVVDVLKSGILAHRSGAGPKVLEFERSFAKFIGVKHAVAMSSGTASLHASLLAAGINRGDEVVLPSFTFHATAEAVLLAGAKPVFADIDPETYCITADTIESVMTKRTKAIIAVHLYGLPADMAPMLELARKRGVAVIEDATQAHGAEYRGKHVGSIGDMACFSFYAGKNITAGEGGVVTTNDDDYAEQLRMIRTYGEQRPGWPVRLGHNYHMNEIEAAIVLVQLGKLPSFLERRAKNARSLTEKVSTLGKVIPPKEPEGRKHAWYLYTIRLRGANPGKRNRVVEKLRAKNIEARCYYDTPIHALPLYKQLAGSSPVSLPETERASRQVLSLPIHPKVSDRDLQYIFETLKKAIA